MTVDEMEVVCARLERELEVLEERYWESARKHAEKTTVMQAEIETLREALEGMLSAYDDDRLFGDDPIEVSIARAALAGTKGERV